MPQRLDFEIRLTARSALLGAATLAGAASVAAQDGAALAAFRARHGSAWRLGTDPATHRPRKLEGGAFPLLRASGSSRASEAELLDAARAFVREAATVLALDSASLRPAPLPVVTSADGRLAAVHFDVTHEGVPVEGERVTLVVSGGSLLHVHVVAGAPIRTSSTPTLTAGAAREAALAALRLAPGGISRHSPPPFLLWTRVREPARLAWMVTLVVDDPPSRHVALVDARDGSTLRVTDETVSQCAAPPPGGRPGRVLGGVRPRRADDPEREELLASARVGGTVSDAAGLFAPQPSPSAATLDGPVVSVECVGCATPDAPFAPAGSTGDADFGSGGRDETGNGLATPADRACFFHVERAQRQASRWLALPWLSRPVTVRTNLQDECNAYWNGVALNFFRSSLRCANTGEIRDVVSHEWGHGLDENDGLPPPGVSVDAATGEAVADIVAMLRSRDPCVGESFFADPSDFPSPACSGVRDLDEISPGHRRGTLTTSNAASACSPSPFYRGPLGREGHCEGEILGQAFWHLVRTLATGASYADGRPLAAPLGDETAWQVAEALFYRSRPFLASYAPTSLQSIGMSAHDAFLLADDEGDGVANGTPHAWAIRDAFEHHGIAETGSPPPTASPCAAVAPAVTVTPTPDAALGRSIVRIDWTDSGAARYLLLRDDADGGGQQPLAPAFGPGPGSFDDRGTLPGRAARYVVVAETADGCLAPSIAAIPSASALLEVAAVRIDDTATGDGDGRLAAGETADVFVDLRNVGDAPFSNAAASLEAVDPELSLVVAGPLAYGTVAGGATVPGPSAFRVQALPGAGSRVTLALAAQGDEGCLRASWLLPIARPDLDREGENVDDASGDADGTWDPGERVELMVNLRNRGDRDALAVTGALSFRAGPPAGVTLPGSSGTWGTIPAGALAPSVVPGFALDATPAVRNGTLVQLLLDVSIAGVAHRSYPVDLVVGGVASGILEWEARTETWSPDATGSIVNQVLVAQTSDDDGDGRITGCDVPDIIIEQSNITTDDEITVLSGDDGRILHRFPVNPCRPDWTIFQTLAVGDVDGDGVPEIVADARGWPCAFELDGTLLWRTATQAWNPEFTPGFCAAAPQVWDVDADGDAEVVVGRAVIDGATGAIAYTDTTTRDTGRSLVGDIDQDGLLDVISYRGDVRDASGAIAPRRFPGFWQMGGLVDLDGDPEAEVVYTAVVDQPSPTVVAREHDGTLLWEWPYGPGHDSRPPPCFGDFDGDGRAETAVPAGSEMVMLDDDGSVQWVLPTDDSSGASGCSVFDFDRDGRPEIVYRDERNMKVIHGGSGLVLWQVPCLSFTQHEFPIVADVDADGSAEIVVYAYVPPDRAALRVYGNPAWPAARGIWNQENYSVTHVADDGAVVTTPTMRWTTGNDFRGQSNGCSCTGAQVEASADLPCGTTVACFSARTTGGVAPFTITWDFGDGSPEREGSGACHDYAPGRHVARVVATDTYGCPAETAVIVDVPEDLAATVSGTATCVGTSCFTVSVTGGVAPHEIAWDFDGGVATDTSPSACHDFIAPSYAWHVAVRDAAGCLVELADAGRLGTPPAPVGAALFVTDHSAPRGADIEATLDWRLDGGLPRPAGESYLILRGTRPTVLDRIPATAGWLPTSYRDSTPAATSLPFVHFYVILAEDACGAPSTD